MIIKFSKAEFKDKAKSKANLLVSVSNGINIYSLKTPRRIRQGVANFFGETLEVPLFGDNLFFFVEEVGLKIENLKVLNFCFESEKVKSGEANYGNMVNENEFVKLFWSWQLDTLFSIQNSSMSRDLMSIETPKKFTREDVRMELRTFSPEVRIKKKEYFSSDYEEALSERISSSPSKSRNSKFKKGEEFYKHKLNHLQHINSKSFAIPSKTPDKKHQIIRRPSEAKKSIREINGIQPSIPNTEQIINLKKPRESNRKGSVNLNKMGAIMASTVGVLAGLVAGMVLPY